ncbi:hypothetical protein LINGRAHAP2_LOCUS11593 [Linum grandiflorum]
MIVLAWNCRGLGNTRAVRVLGELIKAHRPDVVFLSETLVSNQKMEEVRVKIKFEGCFAVAARGRSGGLIVLWREKNQVLINQFCDNYIDAQITDAVGGEFRFTGYYGFPERERRKEAWEMLKRLGNGVHGPWCIMGDFNDILHQDEQKGRHLRPQPLIDGFRAAVAECNLVDIQLDGYPYTWARAKGQSHGVESRLDRAMVNAEWIERYMNGKLRNLVAPYSDHAPILLDTDPRPGVRRPWRFRFENAWRREAAINPLVEEAWREEMGEEVTHKLQACAAALEVWGRGFARRFRHRGKTARAGGATHTRRGGGCRGGKGVQG